MTENTILKDDFIRSFSEHAGEPKEFTDFRLAAWKLASELDLPFVDKTKIDRWNFTKFDTYQAFTNENAEEVLPEKVQNLVALDDASANFYVQIDTHPAKLQLNAELKSQGVIFTDIFTALKEHPELVLQHLMTEAVKPDEHKLAAFHAALMNGGIFLYVPKNVEIKEPIQAVFVQKDASLPLVNHVLLVADENSSVTYVENYVTLDDTSKGIVNIVEEVVTRRGAKVTFGAVDNLSGHVTAYVNRRGHIGADSRIEWALGLMNDGDTINENVTNLMGDGSSGDVKTVTVGRGKQTQNVTTRVTHYGKASTGTILSHGVMKDKATTIFNGIGHIKHGASKSDAQQESRVLMLSQGARGDANPILLIDENDVVAGHAASVGRVDPVQLFYLMSRGISRAEAERLVIHGFLDPVVKQLPIEGVKVMLKEVIEGKVR
ncbi:putative aminotransferase [Listeria floridensis FSL S10-1187]|uniref:Aminotransferase n=1 Tax=Listeria floridensis FSL S10-1187 TaxID=1265817 RepID=A0ABN0REQ7_9LIST|nr:Fe-S cluster assembly protein SufD [Listeria floridensis]EUJ31384.1 putative aminotransferase [Listeria floridensis FSL S10-1187]